jgi:hypothetical protein
MIVAIGIFHGLMLDATAEQEAESLAANGNAGRRSLAFLFITIGNLTNKNISMWTMLASNFVFDKVSSKLAGVGGTVQWLNNHFNQIMEAAVLCSAVALSVLGYGSPYSWALSASIALGIFSRSIYAPQMVTSAVKEARGFSGAVLLLHPSRFVQMIGAFTLYQKLNDYILNSAPRQTLTYAQFKEQGEIPIKLSQGHIHTHMQLSGLGIELDGFVTMAEGIDWNNTVNYWILAEAFRNDEKWIAQPLYTGVVIYVKSAIPKVIARVKESDDEQLKFKLQHVLRQLPQCTTEKQALCLSQLARDGVYSKLKLMEMVDSLYAAVCGVPDDLENALIEGLERYRKKEMDQKITDSDEYANYILQRITGWGYHIPKKVPLNLEKIVLEFSTAVSQKDIMQALEDGEMMDNIRLFYLYNNEVILKVLSVADYLYAGVDRLHQNRSYFAAWEMVDVYEKNILTIVQNWIDENKMSEKVEVWLKAWVEKQNRTYCRNDYYDDDKLKPKTIALILMECGIAEYQTKKDTTWLSF